jgi:hypothetical protein
MTNQATGQKQLKVEEKWIEAEKILNDYSQSLGLNAIAFNNESEKALNLTANEIKQLTPEEISIQSYILAHYSTFLQKEINRQTAKLKWANHNISVIVAKVGANYGDKWVKYEERKMLVVGDNEYAKILSDIALQASIRVEELSFLSSRISAMSDILDELHKTKKWK